MMAPMSFPQRTHTGVIEKREAIGAKLVAKETKFSSTGLSSLLLDQSEVDELYDLLDCLTAALDELEIPHIIAAGSLLGAIRSQSILFNDDDVDVAIVDNGKCYERLLQSLPSSLNRGSLQRNSKARQFVKYTFHRRPWEACDRVKSSAAPRVWINLFVLRKYESPQDLRLVLESDEFVPKPDIAALLDLCFPLYHYDNRQAIERWPREYFLPSELFPIQTLIFGHLRVPGPSDTISPLRRFFGSDCFTHFMCVEHPYLNKPSSISWEEAERIPLSDEQFLPVQHSCKEKRVWSQHSRQALMMYISENEVSPDVKDSPVSVEGMGLHRTRTLFSLSAGSTMTMSSRSTLWSTSSASSSSLSLEEVKPTKWFGVDVRRVTKGRPEAPDFQTKELRNVVEPHIAKARLKRDQSRRRSHLQVDASIASSVGVPYTSLRSERPFLFDVVTYPIHEVLASTLGVRDLSLIHEHKIQDKFLLMSSLLERDSRRCFHECYDNFVTSFCIPLLHSLAMEKSVFQTTLKTASNKINYRYQAFPCIRIVRPGEFSIGPHCDTAYGHTIGSLNFHVPLTPTFGTNALYTESHPGREDWHPLTTKLIGLGYIFDGSRCIHFTTENTTDRTRVSIDFRIAIYRDDERNSGIDGGLCTREMLEDQYSKSGSCYYEEATVNMGVVDDFLAEPVVARKRGCRLVDPDKRVGFPFNKV